VHHCVCHGDDAAATVTSHFHKRQCARHISTHSCK